MRTLLTDARNDFFINPDGSMALVSGPEAIADVAKHFAYTARDEQIYDRTNGIPFWPTVFGKTATLQQFESALRVRLLQSPGIASIQSLEVVKVGEVIKYTAYLITTAGEPVNING